MKKSVYQKFSIVFLVGGIFFFCARAFALPTELHWEFAGYGGGGAFPEADVWDMVSGIIAKPINFEILLKQIGS